jgi:hypothetical protein
MNKSNLFLAVLFLSGSHLLGVNKGGFVVGKLEELEGKIEVGRVNLQDANSAIGELGVKVQENHDELLGSIAQNDGLVEDLEGRLDEFDERLGEIQKKHQSEIVAMREEFTDALDAQREFFEAMLQAQAPGGEHLSQRASKRRRGKKVVGVAAVASAVKKEQSSSRKKRSRNKGKQKSKLWAAK